jgi:PKD domain/Peptidase M66
MSHSLGHTCWSTVCVFLMMTGLATAADLRPDERLAIDAFERELGARAVAARSGNLVADSQNLVKAARDRHAVMRRLVREDPQQAVALALDRVRRKLVPAAAQGELEQEVSTMGRLEVLVARPVDSTQKAIVKRQAVIDGQRYDVATWGGGLQDVSATKRSLHGVVVDGVLALLPGRLRVLKAGESVASGKRLDDQRCSVSGKLAGANQEPDDGLDDVIVESGDAVHVLCQGGHIAQLGDQIAAAEAGSAKLASSWTMGPKTVLYSIARCADETAFPETTTVANGIMTAVAARYSAQSWGQTTMTYKIIEIVLPKTKAEYIALSNGDYTLLDDARAAAIALDPSNNLDNWSFDCVRFTPLWGWGGQGFVGGKGTWLQYSSSGTAIHELGHNYGLMHANFWNTSETSVIGAGSNGEYGDPYSEMGGDGQFSAFEKWRLDWILTANTQIITTSGTYRVHASDSATAPSGSAMYALRITKDSQRDYWISHRREFSNAWNLDGVHLHWDPWAITGIGDSNGGGQLLDTTPGTAQGKNDAALVRGRTFADTASNIYITPMTLNTGTTPVSMDVVVKIGPFPSNRNPTVSISASSTSVATGATVSFTATASDPDGDPLAVYWDMADDTWASNTLTPTKSWGTAKIYPVRVTVSDMKGGSASATVLVTVGSVSTFMISGAVLTSGGAGVEGVRVHRGTTTGSVWTNSDGTYALPNLSAGSYTVSTQKDGAIFAANFTNPVTVGPNATGKNFTQGNLPPTVATPAAANLATVTATTTTLSVLGADDGGEASLTYTWAVTGTPPAAVTYSSNGNNAARSSVVTFTKAGTYPFQVTIADLSGLTVTSAVTVTVNQTNTTVVVSPMTPVVHVGSTQTFTASSKDQFGTTLSAQPTFSWSVSGGKTISSGGVVSAITTAGGPYTVTASSGGKSGTTTFTVINDTPIISVIADQTVAVSIPTSAIPFTIGDTETAATSLTLTKVSSDIALVPTANIVLGGSGANRTVSP